MSVPRIYSPTPLFLFPKTNRNDIKPDYLYPVFEKENFKLSPIFGKGRDCLSFLMKVMKKVRPERDEVIIPSYNAHSLVIAAIHCKLKVKLVDINKNHFFPEPKEYAENINKKTLLVILPYNFGIIPPLEWIKEIKKYCCAEDIYVIDDFASTMPGKYIIEYFNQSSEIMLFSLGKTKIFTIMDGGFYAVRKNSSHLYDLRTELQNREKLLETKNKYSVINEKFISNILYHFYCNRIGNSLLSFIGLTQKERLPVNLNISEKKLPDKWSNTLSELINKYFIGNIEHRKKINSDYFNKIGEVYNNFCFFDSLKNNIGSRFPVLFKKKGCREKAIRIFQKNGIGVSTGFVKWLGEFDLFSDYLKNIDKKKYSNGMEFQDLFMTLPVNMKVREKDIDNIKNILNEIEKLN